MKKIALVAALVAGFASAAVAQDAAPDSVRNYGPVAGQYQSRQLIMIEGRNVYSAAAPKTAEELWFRRASDVGNY
jgi:opacity protein-like surface antigen